MTSLGSKAEGEEGEGGVTGAISEGRGRGGAGVAGGGGAVEGGEEDGGGTEVEGAGG